MLVALMVISQEPHEDTSHHTEFGPYPLTNSSLILHSFIFVSILQCYPYIFLSNYHSNLVLSIITVSIMKTKHCSFKVGVTCPIGHTTEKLQLDSNTLFLPSWSLKEQFFYFLLIKGIQLLQGRITSILGPLGFISHFDIFFPAYTTHGFLSWATAYKSVYLGSLREELCPSYSGILLELRW